MTKAIWYFSAAGEKVFLRARLEGEDGIIGDAIEEIGPGETFCGISYEEFKELGAGTMTVVNGHGQF
jgi:hypothetical protein